MQAHKWTKGNRSTNGLLLIEFMGLSADRVYRSPVRV